MVPTSMYPPIGQLIYTTSSVYYSTATELVVPLLNFEVTGGASQNTSTICRKVMKRDKKIVCISDRGRYF